MVAHFTTHGHFDSKKLGRFTRLGVSATGDRTVGSGNGHYVGEAMGGAMVKVLTSGQ
jgi:hypothetical protein